MRDSGMVDVDEVVDVELVEVDAASVGDDACTAARVSGSGDTAASWEHPETATASANGTTPRHSARRRATWVGCLLRRAMAED
ncbi:MAG: hypothetical protein RJB61_1205 [Actinomycetota bacterium]|jgi:hypothetical protein